MSDDVCKLCVYKDSRPLPRHCHGCDNNHSGFVRADRQDRLEAELESLRAENDRMRPVVEMSGHVLNYPGLCEYIGTQLFDALEKAWKEAGE